MSEDVKLPVHVAEVRELILSAVRSGQIEDLRAALESAANKPDFGSPGIDDPIAALKHASGDADGREALAAMSEVLSLAPATLPLGRDLENNLIFVWHYLAERPLDKLTPGEQVELLKLVSPAKA